jgi:hypothetical protein
MTRPSFATYLSGAFTRLFASGALTFAAVVVCAFALCVSPQADAQTHRGGARHAHGAIAHALKAACSTHAKHSGSHSCAPPKAHKHGAKAEAHRKHAIGSLHAPAQGKASTPAPTLGGSSGATCSNGVNATLDEEGSFACSNGAEPGCQEGFAPAVSGDGSTLVCEPELSEAGGEEEG